jgi:hypothetical protein
MAAGYNYTLKYKTFDKLLAEVRSDFPNYKLENFIEPQTLIKIAKKCNYDLGLRINRTAEAILEVEKGRVKLPDNFYTWNYGAICDSVTVVQTMPQGTNIQEVPYKETSNYIDPCTESVPNCQKCTPAPCSCNCPVDYCSETEYNPLVPYGDSCVKPRVFVNCKNECYELVQVINPFVTNVYSVFLPLKLLPNAENIDCDCPNLYMHSNNVAWIEDGFLKTNFTSGKVYINYQSNMEDEDGNLLVVDHDMINEYYEYALKKRFLENLIMNDEVVNQAKIQLIQAGYREARNYALSIVNTPNFAELKRVWEANRRAMYGKYYNMFKSYPWYQWDKNPNNMMGEKIIR